MNFVSKMQISLSVFLLLASSALINSAPSEVSDVTILDRSNRVVNGEEVDITQVSYHAALRRKVTAGWAYACGAAVISNRAVLTAAHCVVGYEFQPSNLRVNVGSSYRLSGGKSYYVSRVFVHESYDADYLVHDIALLKTSTKIKFSSKVNPIMFASSNIYLPSGTEALVSGFGLTRQDGIASPVLLAAKVSIVDQATCARAYIRLTDISSGMVCANATSPPRDACQGDSGGPLVANGMLVGIVSWGEGCAVKNYPGVYTRVSEYHSWITEKIWLLF